MRRLGCAVRSEAITSISLPEGEAFNIYFQVVGALSCSYDTTWADYSLRHCEPQHYLSATGVSSTFSSCVSSRQLQHRSHQLCLPHPLTIPACEMSSDVHYKPLWCDSTVPRVTCHLPPAICHVRHATLARKLPYGIFYSFCRRNIFQVFSSYFVNTSADSESKQIPVIKKSQQPEFLKAGNYNPLLLNMT